MDGIYHSSWGEHTRCPPSSQPISRPASQPASQPASSGGIRAHDLRLQIVAPYLLI